MRCFGSTLVPDRVFRLTQKVAESLKQLSHPNERAIEIGESLVCHSCREGAEVS